jgi:RNA polymerase sigma-70 factor (ECF subfamily)
LREPPGGFDEASHERRNLSAFVSEWVRRRVQPCRRTMATNFPETRDSLLVQLKSPANREAWDQFALVYRPVICRLARRRGLQDADAQDLAQRVLMAIASAIGSWEKSSESVQFRHWLRRVARNAIVNALSRRPHDRAAGGSAVHELLLEQAHPDPESNAQIELEYRRELYRQAARIVRSDVETETWRAFELTVIQNRSIDEAAIDLEKPVGTIYAARSRIMRRLRETVRELEKADS